MRLVFWFEVLVGASIFVEHVACCVAHNGILSFVGSSKYTVQRLKLFLCQTSLTESERHTESVFEKQHPSKMRPLIQEKMP